MHEHHSSDPDYKYKLDRDRERKLHTALYQELYQYGDPSPNPLGVLHDIARIGWRHVHDLF